MKPTAAASHSRRMIQLGSTTVVLLLVLLRSVIPGLDLHTICVIVSVLGAVAVWVTTRITTQGPWSAASAYLVVFVLFHFGLALLNATDQPVPQYAAGYVYSWFNGYGSAPEALYVSALACWVFVAAVAWATPPTSSTSPPAGGSLVEGPTAELVRGSRLGALLVLLGTSTVLGHVAVTVPSLLFGIGGREVYWSSVEGSTAQLVAAPLITYGGVLLALGASGRARTMGLTFLGIFGIWALAVGARSAIMYTALTMVVVVARRRRMPSVRVAFTVFALGLVVAGFVGQARISGVQSDQAGLDPRSGLAELGSSIRPVIEVVQYRRGNNEPLLYGVTYVSFVSRSVERALGLPRPDGLTDSRIAGNEFRGRLDGFQIGYSAVAEAFRNGAVPGVIIVFSVFGAVLGRLGGRRSPTPTGDFVLGVAFFSLAFHIRQPSVSLVANVVFGLLVLFAWRLLTASDEKAVPGPVPATVGADSRPGGHLSGAKDGKA